MGNLGGIETVLFFSVAIGFGVWQFWSTSRQLKRTRAENAAKAAKQENGPPASA